MYVLTCRQVGGLGRRGGDGPGQGGHLNGPSHNVLHKHGSAIGKLWFHTRAIWQNFNPCTGSLILGSLVLGSSVLGSSVLELRIICPRIEDPQYWDYGSLVLGLRILSPRIEDP